MSGNNWTELLQALKKTLGQICTLNKNSKVTILNFSDSVKVEYVDASPSTINIQALTYQGGGTSFRNAFLSGLEHIKKISKHNIVLVFMTDGEDSNPIQEIAMIKSYLNTTTFKSLNIKFDFNAIGFQCNSSILKDMATELGGTTQFAEDGVQLTKAFMEVLNKNIS